MKFLDLKQTLFSEMSVVKLDQNPTHVIGFKDKIWLIGDKTPSKELMLILVQISNGHQDDVINLDQYWYDHQDRTARYIAMHYGDVFVAQYNKAMNGDVTLKMNTDIYLDPRSSPIVKKVVQAVKPKYLLRKDESESKIKSKKSKGKIPSMLYHGTTTRYLRPILTYGLRPGQSASNWGPEFKDRIFLAVSKSMSKRHATNASERQMGKAIVFAIKVPDRSKLSADWDADNMATLGKPEYKRGRQNAVIWGGSQKSMKSGFQASQDLGAFSYKGRIPASMIDHAEILIDGKWKTYSTAELKNNLDSISPDTVQEKYAKDIQAIVRSIRLSDMWDDGRRYARLESQSQFYRERLQPHIDPKNPQHYKMLEKAIELSRWPWYKEHRHKFSEKDWKGILDAVSEQYRDELHHIIKSVRDLYARENTVSEMARVKNGEEEVRLYAPKYPREDHPLYRFDQMSDTEKKKALRKAIRLYATRVHLTPWKDYEDVEVLSWEIEHQPENVIQYTVKIKGTIEDKSPYSLNTLPTKTIKKGTIAYHGTSHRNKESIQKDGLRAFPGSTHGALLGKGTYVTFDKNETRELWLSDVIVTVSFKKDVTLLDFGKTGKPGVIGNFFDQHKAAVMKKFDGGYSEGEGLSSGGHQAVLYDPKSTLEIVSVQDVKESLQETSSGNTTTLDDLIKQNSIARDEWEGWDIPGMMWRTPLEIQTIGPEKLKTIKAKGGKKTVWSVRKEIRDIGTQKIVNRYIELMKSKKFPEFPLEDVIILDNDKVLDGNHRIVSALSTNTPLRFVDVAQLFDENLEEGFVTPYEWETKNVVFETDGYKIAVDSLTNARFVTLWTDGGKKVGSLSARGVQDNGEDGKYLGIEFIGIDKPHQGQHLSGQMYRALLKYMKPEYKGTVSYLPQRSNKKQIPAIYRRFKTRLDGDFHYIERE